MHLTWQEFGVFHDAEIYSYYSAGQLHVSDCGCADHLIL